ncbi:MAG: hypothetical protein U1C53_01280, partial [Candidatus Veblenbacteria bacterium]|nr:hypothetical protein [Candidatus Veblenbacteria bacterium]
MPVKKKRILKTTGGHMRELDVGLFLGVDDIEIGQYHILSAFKVCRDGYFSKRIYPSLAKLIELKHVLEAVINGEVYLREKFPRKIIEFDVENAKVIYGPLPSASKRVQVTIELIEWALPQIQRLIEEGRAIFDF